MAGVDPVGSGEVLGPPGGLWSGSLPARPRRPRSAVYIRGISAAAQLWAGRACTVEGGARMQRAAPAVAEAVGLESRHPRRSVRSETVDGDGMERRRIVGARLRRLEPGLVAWPRGLGRPETRAEAKYLRHDGLSSSSATRRRLIRADASSAAIACRERARGPPPRWPRPGPIVREPILPAGQARPAWSWCRRTSSGPTRPTQDETVVRIETSRGLVRTTAGLGFLKISPTRPPAAIPTTNNHTLPYGRTQGAQHFQTDTSRPTATKRC